MQNPAEDIENQYSTNKQVRETSKGDASTLDSSTASADNQQSMSDDMSTAPQQSNTNVAPEDGVMVKKENVDVFVVDQDNAGNNTFPMRKMENMEKLMYELKHVPEDMKLKQNNVVMNAVVLLKGQVDAQALWKVMDSATGKYDRFRAFGNSDGVWTRVPTIDAAYHFTVKEVGDIKEADQIFADLREETLDLEKPLWKVCLVNSPTQSTVQLRIHHSIADGISLVGMMMHILTDAQGAPIDLEGSLRAKYESAKKNAAKRSFFKAVVHYIWSFFNFFISFFGALTVAQSSWQTATPYVNIRKAADVVSSGVRIPITFPDIDMAIVHFIRKEFKCTVNDVLQSCYYGMIKRYNKAQGFDDYAKQRVFTVISVPPTYKESVPKSDRLGNNWTLVPKLCRLNEATAVERLSATKKGMQHLKQGWAAIMNFFLVKNIMPALGAGFTAMTARDVWTCHGSTWSNVVGPDTTVFLAGVEVLRWAIPFYNVPNCAIGLSYNNKYNMTITLEPSKVKDPWTLVPAYLEEMLELVEAVTVEEGSEASKTKAIYVENLKKMIGEQYTSAMWFEV